MPIHGMQLYGVVYGTGSSTVEPVRLDPETKMIQVQLYALSNAGSSVSIQPVYLDVDGLIRRTA